MVIFIFLLGLAVGSFIAAYTYRAPRGMSIAKGRSACVHCKNRLSWYENIPLVFYALLGGRCRHCGKKISFRYPAIELGTATVFLLIFLRGQDVAFSLAFGAGLVAVFVTDIEHHLILDEVVFFLLGLALIQILLLSVPIYLFLLAGLSASVFLLVLHLVTRGRGMGLGDVKLAIPLGISLGPAMSLIWLYSSFIIGGAIGLILLVSGTAKLKQRIAFGPFLIAGYLVSWLVV